MGNQVTGCKKKVHGRQWLTLTITVTKVSDFSLCQNNLTNSKYTEAKMWSQTETKLTKYKVTTEDYKSQQSSF